jgi:hypothetical protein
LALNFHKRTEQCVPSQIMIYNKAEHGEQNIIQYVRQLLCDFDVILQLGLKNIGQEMVCPSLAVSPMAARSALLHILQSASRQQFDHVHVTISPACGRLLAASNMAISNNCCCITGWHAEAKRRYISMHIPGVIKWFMGKLCSFPQHVAALICRHKYGIFMCMAVHVAMLY